MTLEQLFEQISANPSYVILYFSIIPFTALLAGLLGKGEGHLNPWKYLYSVLIYLVTIPGVFAVTLNVYQFLFDRTSIRQMEVFTQILPIVSMLATLFIIGRNVDMKYIPGFRRLSALFMMLTAVFVIMWIFDKTRIMALTYVRFEYVLLLFIGLLVVIRYSWYKAFK